MDIQRLLSAARTECPADSTSVTLRTDNLDLAAYLLAMGHSLRAVERGHGWRHLFAFDRTAEPDVQAYLDGASIVARDYALALRSLKALIHRG